MCDMSLLGRLRQRVWHALNRWRWCLLILAETLEQLKDGIVPLAGWFGFGRLGEGRAHCKQCHPDAAVAS